MTKGEIKARIEAEQLKFDKLVLDLVAQNKSLQCMAIVKQTLKINQLKELLDSVSEKGESNVE